MEVQKRGGTKIISNHALDKIRNPNEVLMFLSVATKNRVLNVVPNDSARETCWYLLTCHLF